MANRLVGARELKVRLGTYLRRVRSGQTLTITDRGLPVAELRPLSGAHGDDAVLAALAAKGAVTVPRMAGGLRPIQAVRCDGPSVSSAVVEGRQDRL